MISRRLEAIVKELASWLDLKVEDCWEPDCDDGLIISPWSKPEEFQEDCGRCKGTGFLFTEE